ncbi:TonB-dependent siderophore receptor [Povalibacter sp.]|uniref:TonB-dependent siderophore receptor n=1 Tax=Povalibacter sp. TaxID=1962978 RepID=UPI002F420C25
MKRRLQVRLGPLCALVVGLAWSYGSGEIACSAEPVKYQLNIASQPLGNALQEFARQSGVQIIFFSRLTRGLSAPAVSGQYTTEEALAALLAGSNLTFRVLNPKTVEIRARPVEDAPDPPTPRMPDKVDEAQAPRGLKKSAARRTDVEEVIVNATAEGLVATRTETPLRAIPQTVSVISSEQMRQQGDTDLAEVMGRATGITLVRTNSADQKFYSRGFEITTFHVDGGAALRSHAESPLIILGTPDLSEFERIELLRGADGLFSANGNPGGTVNMVRKRPLHSYELSVDASVGSWNQYRIETDLTGPLTADGRLRGRMDALYSQRGYFYDTAELERTRIFAVLEYDIAPQTLLTVGGSYQWDNALPFVGGLPFYANGNDTHLPRDTALTFDWANYRTEIRQLYLQLQHEFLDHWKVRLNTSSWDGYSEHAYAAFSFPVDPVTDAMRGPPIAAATARPSIHEQIALDLTLTGSFDWFGRRQELAFGADFARVRARMALNDYWRYGPTLADIHEFDPLLYPGSPLRLDPTLHYDVDSVQEQTGLFASWRVYLEDWSAIAGARLSSNHIRSNAIISAGPASASRSVRFGNSDVLTPYAAVMYDLSDNYSLYASYADIYRAGNGARRIDGSEISPIRGINIEAGVKGAWHGGALNGQLVLYRISQRNIPVPETRPSPPGSGLECCVAGATHRSEGAEIELTGLLQPGWLIGAGYTFNHNEAALGGDLSSWTPTHLFKLWTSKQLPGVLDRWTIGGSVHAQSPYSVRGTYCEQPLIFDFCGGEAVVVDTIQSEYVTVDLRASFDFSPNWQLALNVNNIFDKAYYQTLGASHLNNWYGEPRSAMLRLDGRY